MRLLFICMLLVRYVCGEVIEGYTDSNMKKTDTENAVQIAQQRVASGNLLLKKGKNELALKLFQDAVVFDPTSHDSWSGLGNIQAALGRVKDAEASLQRAEALAPPRKPLPKEIVKLKEKVEEARLAPASLADCDYPNHFETKVAAIVMDVKRGRKLTKDHSEWMTRLQTAVKDLTDAGFDWTEQPAKKEKKEKKIASSKRKKAKTGHKKRR